MNKILRKISALLIILCCGAICFSACDKDKDTGHYDSITKTLKLNKTYNGKNFYTDGIGKATVNTYTDGDTTLFNLENTDAGNTVNVRYYCIDTPESTIGVEKWGKSASNFTKKQLESATEIVLEASTTPASTDTNGSRYIAYVWYKTADYKDFKCLNLEIVENGYSENKAMPSYAYYEYFKRANDFAKSNKLHLYSDDDDPLYDPNPTDTTLKELSTNPSKFYDAETGAGAKVRFEGYLKSLTRSGSGTCTFVAEQYDSETGQIYRINVFAGYAGSSSAADMVLGHLYQLVGTVQNYNDSWQISGIEYSSRYPKPDNTHTIQKNYYYTFDSGVAWTSNTTATLYSNVTVTSVSVDGTVMTIQGTAQQTKNGTSGAAANFTFKVEVESGYTSTLSVGNQFSANAYKFDANENVWTILSVNDIVKK